jgi:hypothetical protein
MLPTESPQFNENNAKLKTHSCQNVLQSQRIVTVEPYKFKETSEYVIVNFTNTCTLFY